MTLAAQGFTKPRPEVPTARHLHRVMRDVGALQIDSVNVFARSHYMPMFSRLGAYDTSRLDALLFGAGGPYTEYWAHVATFIPTEDWGLWQFRMDALRTKYGEDPKSWYANNTETVRWVRDELAARGPLRPAEIEDDLAASAKRGPWWDWNRVKQALELMFLFGEVAIAGRRGFERRYGLVEQVIPESARTPIPRAEAIRELMARALASYGVATIADLADYYRLTQKDAATAVRELEDEGVAVPVTVEGWTRASKPVPAYRHRDAVAPRAVDVTALLTPFDPVVWFRDRAARMYDFDYRIEIYTPEAKRTFGYYSLPILAGDNIVGRIDLKADRAKSTLLVQSAWWEHESHVEHAEAIAAEVRRAAAWQGLENISVSRWGSATESLAGALTGSARHDRGSA